MPEARILKVIGSMEDPATPEKIVKETVKKFGKIDVLVRIEILFTFTSFSDQQRRLHRQVGEVGAQLHGNV